MTSPSSGESSASQLPAFSINMGAKAIVKEKTGTSSTAGANIKMEIPAQDDISKNPGQDDPVGNDQAPPDSTVVVEQHDNPAMRKPAEAMATEDEVVVTAEQHNPALETSTTLAKIIAKDESPRREGKNADSQLQAFESMDANSLHQQYLTRISQNREAESALVALLKKKYEAMLTQAGQEIAELKEEVKVEKGKREAAEKLSSDYQESLLNVTDSLEKAKTDFAKEKETLTRRAEEAEA